MNHARFFFFFFFRNPAANVGHVLFEIEINNFAPNHATFLPINKKAVRSVCDLCLSTIDRLLSLIKSSKNRGGSCIYIVFKRKIQFRVI